MRLINTDLSPPAHVVRTQEFLGLEVPEYAILSRMAPFITLLGERFTSISLP
jgi:hypothetical protein